MLVPWALAALAFLGLFAQPWPPRRLRGELALLASLAAPASYIPFFVVQRYLAGMLLPAMVWIGAGAWLLGLWLTGTVQNLRQRPLSGQARRALLAAPTLLLALLLLGLGPRTWNAAQRTHSFQPGHLAAAAGAARAGRAGRRGGDEPLSGHRLPRRHTLGRHAGRRAGPRCWPTPASTTHAIWPSTAGRRSFGRSWPFCCSPLSPRRSCAI
ncbi:MAG: hypothetical protein V9H69_12280 [Anaerolineae bacterium]